MLKKLDELELRSKEVQDLMGKIPSWLIRNGTVMVVLLLGVLIAGSWFFRYPDVVLAPFVVTVGSTTPSSLTGCAKLSRNGVEKVKIGQQVVIKFVAYPYLEYGMVKGLVRKISSVPTNDAYDVEVDLPNPLVTNYGKKLAFQEGLLGTAEIMTEDISLLNRILHPVKSQFKREVGK